MQGERREGGLIDMLLTRLGQGLVLLRLMREHRRQQSRWQEQSELALFMLQVKGLLVGEPGQQHERSRLYAVQGRPKKPTGAIPARNKPISTNSRLHWA